MGREQLAFDPGCLQILLSQKLQGKLAAEVRGDPVIGGYPALGIRAWVYLMSRCTPLEDNEC
jgi:hypothetical protein